MSNMNKIIDVGTVARLKSGGPLMTCIRESEQRLGYYDWAYFNKGCAEALVLICVHPNCIDVVSVEAEKSRNRNFPEPPDPPPPPEPRIVSEGLFASNGKSRK